MPVPSSPARSSGPRLSLAECLVAVVLATPICLAVSRVGNAVLPPYTRLPTLALVALWPAVLPLAWARFVPPAGVDDELRGFLIAVFVMVSIAVALVVAVIHGLAACWLALGLVAILLYLPHRMPR
jgi:hypothetical protein